MSEVSWFLIVCLSVIEPRRSMRALLIQCNKRYVSFTSTAISLLTTLSQAGGLATPAESGTLTNFVEIGQARDKILSLKLDQISGTSSVAGTATSIDPKGYLTDLASVVHKTDAEIGDIKRARMLFDSLVKSNPKHAPGWIAAACVEEHAGRMVAARKLIKAGCENCPKSEDVWLEAARLHVSSDHYS